MSRYFTLLPLLEAQKTLLVFFQFYSRTLKPQDMKSAISLSRVLQGLVTLQLSLSAVDSEPSIFVRSFYHQIEMVSPMICLPPLEIFVCNNTVFLQYAFC